MVFMADSERAAKLAIDCGLDAGLHLNFTDRFTGQVSSGLYKQSERVIRFLKLSKYTQLIYNPLLTHNFRDLFNFQFEEYLRLYKKPPTHIDGHQHMHLCSNVRIAGLIPAGLKVRRNFSFERDEKSYLNRMYRKLSDRSLKRKYRITDYFFSLGRCLITGKVSLVADLARTSSVELMTHPNILEERRFLLGDAFPSVLGNLPTMSYADL